MKYCPMCKSDLVDTDLGRKRCSNCPYVFWNTPAPVVAMLIERGHGIVLVQRGVAPFKGGWCLPCGYIDPCETPEQAAIREVKEETGLDVEIIRLLEVCDPHPEKNQIILFYLCREVGGILRGGDDSLDAQIYTKANMPQVCFSAHQDIIDEWLGIYRE
ncbi:MAG: NUDIX hydrolase [Candidatus Vogelbacteria bacterium]|nr:NUDIX hydrolase [Candidatus Vogelbacteria bacterium]